MMFQESNPIQADPSQQLPTNTAVAPPVFGTIIPSRPVQTDFIHLPPNRFLLQFGQADSINHLVVFLTGIVPLPENYAASIHFQFPNKPDWHLLGMLSATKPSAIFRLKGTLAASQTDWANVGMEQAGPTATLGILVGPQEQIEGECVRLNQGLTLRSAGEGSARQDPSLGELAKAIGLNLFRYISSFATTTFDNDSWIPISVLEKWWKSFEAKLHSSLNPQQWLLDSSVAG